MSETTYRDWFRRFKNNDFDLEYKEHSGIPKRFEDEELEAPTREDSRQAQAELVESLGFDHTTVSKRLKALRMIQNQEFWVPYELKPINVEWHLVTCELLLQRQERKGFLHRIVTGDEKCIQYDKP